MMKPMKMMLTTILGIGLTAGTALADMPKYVFFFLGDGMSSSQIQATEAYLTTANGGSATRATDLQKEENRLNMSKLPVLGMQTTYDAHALMTDSASSATAFSCGIKTMSGVIGMDENKTIRYKSIAQLAKEQGRKVGVISSVSLDHATPAAYYASVPSRNNYNDIEVQLVESGYDFFGGGGLKKPTDTVNIWDLLTENGYAVINDRDSIMALVNEPKDKVICINPWLQDSGAMPYAIDRPETNVSLRDMTEVAIACLTADEETTHAKKSKHRHQPKHRVADAGKGFFLMVEGGKIDWACHANDAMAAIGDTLAFDKAIGAAIDFYNQHPRETLIIVTGDHETGGMTIGHATTGYSAHYDVLLGQANSFTYVRANQWATHKSSYSAGYDYTLDDNLSSNSNMVDLLTSSFGLVWDELNDYQKEKLEDAYDLSMCGTNKNSSAENTLLYGGYEPIIVTITHIMNENASIGWTSYSHTGVPVPVFAMGADAGMFAGFYDNTDIAKKIAKAMNIREELPIER
jgi:alkaline phosphatase